ncbi:MAG: type I restriction-modification system subunit M [Bacteroidales bacterium]|nr:type I restriction-modification system subunit M [Bacteroidales bacterium]
MAEQQLSKQQLASKIWKMACKLRSKMDANEYKNYILGFIFYKFLSEQEEHYLAAELEVPEDQIEESLANSEIGALIKRELGYYIAYRNLFSTWLKKRSDFRLSDVTAALNSFRDNIGSSHQDVFKGIFNTLDGSALINLGKNDTERTNAIYDIMNLIKDIPMDGKQGYDVLGFVYEYLISNFAASGGKKAGEFYTPHEVSVLMSEIVANHLKDCDEIKIYDPTSGSASLLINIGNSISKYLGDKDKIKYYAQEFNQSAYDLTRMNLVMKGIKPDNIVARQGDTLADDWPYFDDTHAYQPLTNLDAVVSNPPYSQPWSSKGKENDARFQRYGLAPESKADYAFLLHCLYHLRQGGIMTIVLPHGVLFRGGEEAKIRQALIEDNNIDAIIGLPANIFFGTGIPTIIMVLKKGQREDDVLIIDASKDFIKSGTKNVLRACDIKKISDTYIERKETEKYSRRVSRAEIRQNDYNLNIPRYVDSSEKPESVDIYATMFGGIPKSEIDDLNDVFAVFPSLKDELFTSSETPYVDIKCDDVKKTIEENSDVVKYKEKFGKAFDGFDGFLKELLVDNLSDIDVVHEETKIAEEVFSRLKGIPLIDKYAAYQILDDNWNVISSDREFIKEDGVEAIMKVDTEYSFMKKGGREDYFPVGLKGRILPFELVQSICFAAELETIKAKRSELESISGQYEELMDSVPEEERDNFLNDDGDAFDSKKVDERARKLLKDKSVPEKDSADEVVLAVSKLMGQEKILRKAIKDGTEKLEKDTIERIKGMTLDDAISLLVEKWISPIVGAISAMPGTIIGSLEKKVAYLSGKYARTYVSLEKEISEAESSLADMLDDLTGDEYDLMGLKELQKILKGE